MGGLCVVLLYNRLRAGSALRGSSPSLQPLVRIVCSLHHEFPLSKLVDDHLPGLKGQHISAQGKAPRRKPQSDALGRQVGCPPPC